MHKKMPIYAVILAAGKGTRMKSRRPKTLHPVAGQPMVVYVIKALEALKIKKTYVIVGHQAELVKKTIGHKKVYFIKQKQQLGTGHALMQAKKQLSKIKGDVLVLSGDTPLITTKTLKKLIKTHQKSRAAATILTAVMPDPFGYGRVIRGRNGTLAKIVEQKDGLPKDLKVKEVNAGTYCFNIPYLFEALKKIKTNNAQKEYYLTDVIGIMKKKKLPVYACQSPDYRETQGVNTKEELVKVSKIIRQRSGQIL